MGSINPLNNVANNTPNGAVQSSGRHPDVNGGATNTSPPKSARRKQWILHDGPHGSLQRLRLRMAEEGCGHSQVALAKQFLSENSPESDQIAVHWLIKAADQGHYEGLELLKDCFESNRGITEHNYPKIRSFLDMTVQERAARVGAKNLFTTMAQGSDFVTTKQLEQWLEDSIAKRNSAAVTEDNVTETVTDSSLVVGGDLLSEQHLLSAASVYASGHFPPLLRLINLQSQHKLTYLYHWFTHSILNVFSKPLSLSLILTFVIFYTVINSSFQALLNIRLPSFVTFMAWALALAATIIFTAQSCRLVGDWNLFHSWSVLLSQHAQQLQPAVPEYLYISRTFPPFLGRFLLAAVPCVSLQPALHLVRSSLSQTELWIPYGELGVLASLLCSACWPCMRYVWTLTIDDLLCLFGWILLRLEHLPWISNFGADDESIVSDPVEYWQLHPAILIRFHLVAIIAIVILTPLYIRRIRQFPDRTHLLAWTFPHIASLMWLFLAIDWFQMSTLDGVLRGVIFSIAAILLRSNCNWLTKANLLLCCITSYSAGSAIGLAPWFALSLAIFLIAAGRMSAQFLMPSQSHRLSAIFSRLRFIKGPLVKTWDIFRGAILICCLAFLALRMVRYVQNRNFDTSLETVSETNDITHPIVSPDLGASAIEDGDLLPPGTITWEQYREYCCYQSPWSGSSVANSQLACAALHGVKIHWEGVIRQVAVETRFNFAESILHWLPIKWSRWLSCQIGEKWPDCDEAQKQPQSPQNKRCHFFLKINRQRGHQCHVNRFSIFTFRIEVEPNTSRFWDCKSAVDVIAGSSFQSLGFRLTPGDVIQFEGTLSAPSVGGMKPEIRLNAIECVSCEQGSLSLSNPTSLNIPVSLASFVVGAIQGTADFILPHFIRFNVTQLMSSD